MNTFSNLNNETALEGDKDTLGGGFLVDSGVHNMMIEMAYAGQSSKGALSLTLHLRSIADNSLVRSTIYVTSGTAKGTKNTYTDKETGKERPLPGFSLANSLCQVVLGKNLSDVAQEEKVIKRYDAEAKTEVPQKTQVLVELLNQPVQAGIIKRTVDKMVWNQNANAYTPDGTVKDENEVDKFFRARDGLTQTEIQAGATESSFKDKWADKWTGVHEDKSTVSKGAVKKGAPATSAATAPAETSQKTDDNLFG